MTDRKRRTAPAALDAPVTIIGGKQLTPPQQEEVLAADQRLLRAKAELGDIELRIMHLTALKGTKAQAVAVAQQEMVALATTLVRAHGEDPEKAQWHLDVASMTLRQNG